MPLSAYIKCGGSITRSPELLYKTSIITENQLYYAFFTSSRMIYTIYIVILSYFIAGGVSFYFINRNKSKEVARKNYTKIFTYFLIINLLFFSIIYNSIIFTFLSALIILFGFYEMYKVFKQSTYRHRRFYIVSTVIFIALSCGFLYFGQLHKNLILFSFLLISIFDSFSQISGQLWGNKKILPRISPRKTLGGLIGGAVITIGSGFLLSSLIEMNSLHLVVLSGGIITFSFLGDLIASVYKRKYSVKDFSKFLPGHGGFLDRFDSLIVGGAWVGFLHLITGLW